MAVVYEAYKPVPVGVNATVNLNSSILGGFLCKTAGTVTIVDANGTTLITGFPVSAGVYYRMPFRMNGVGGSFTTAGGARGILVCHFGSCAGVNCA